MYQRLSETDPDLVPSKAVHNSLRPLTIVLLAFLAMVFVVGIYMMTKNEYPFLNKKFNTTDSLSTVSSIESTTESEEVVTKPSPEVITTKNLKHNQIDRRYRITPERVVLEDKYIKITDCSATDEFFVEYFTIEPLPFNIHENSTINTRMIMKEGFHWSTEVEIEMEKWFFGLKMLSLKLPCISKFFGSCRFNFCDMLRLHWDQQFCAYIHNNYDMNCQCPDILGPGVFTLNDWHYKPVIRKVLKYFSWFARGWYNLKIKLYKKEKSTKPFLCINTLFKVIAKHPKLNQIS